MKKVLSLVLVLAMVLSSMSFAFGASTFTDVADTDYTDAINTLVGLGVVTGYEDGTYRPEKVVTRAEMAKLIVEVLGYGDLVAGSKSNFSDTQGHWADAWIALAAGKGLVVGTGDGKFTPDRTVSYDEAITMVVRSLGYTDNCNELKNMTWPTNFKVKAAELKLTKAVSLVSTGADRGGVAQLLFNALEANLVTVNTDGDVVYTKNGDSNKILLNSIAKEDSETYAPVQPRHVESDNKAYAGDIVDLTPYMYQNITVYVNDDKDVVYVKESNTLTLEGTVTASTSSDITVEDADEDEYTFDLASAADIMLNGEEVGYTDFASSADVLEDAIVTLVLDAEDDDKLNEETQKVTGIVARLVTENVQLDEEYVEDEVELVADVADVLLPVNDDDEVDFDKLMVTGDADSLQDIQVNDVLALYYAKGVASDDVKLEIVVTRNTAEGKITKINSDGDVTIDGTTYELGDLAIGELSVGDEVILYLDQDGNIYSSEELDSIASNDYALVVDVKDGYETAGGVRLAEPKVKVLTAAGEKITYILDDEDLDVITYPADDTAGDIIVGLNDGDLIQFNVNKDGEIDEIVKVNETTDLDLDLDFQEGIIALKTTGNSFNLASNVVIFSKPADIDDAKVVAKDDLDDTIDATVVYDGAKIVALIVTDGVGESETTYAVVANNTTKVLDEDDYTVIEYTVFVDGEEVTYLGESSTAVSGTAVTGKLVELPIDGGKLDNDSEATEVITDIDNDIKVFTGTADDVRVTTYITADDGTKVYLSDDVVVYVYDRSDVEVELGDKSDIRENDFTAYNLSLDDTNDYEIVIVFVD